MKKMLPFLAVVLFTVATSTDANPGEIVKPSGFLKVENRYTFIFVNGSDAKRVYGEVKVFGPGTWMRVEPKGVRIEPLVEPESGRRRFQVATPPSPRAPVQPEKEPAQTWFNLSKLAAVILDQRPESVVNAPDASSFPKVGTNYYVHAWFGPYFGKVLETSEDGWFRVHEKNPRWSKDTDRSVHWWINLAFLTQLTEAKPEDWPE